MKLKKDFIANIIWKFDHMQGLPTETQKYIYITEIYMHLSNGTYLYEIKRYENTVKNKLFLSTDPEYLGVFNNEGERINGLG